MLETQYISLSIIDRNLVGLYILLGFEVSEFQVVKIILDLELTCLLAKMNTFLYSSLRL